jgi:hypothetical protein
MNQKKEEYINRLLIWALVALVTNYAIVFSTALGFTDFATLFLLVTIATLASVFGAGMLAPKRSKGSLLAPVYALLINALLAAIVLFSCGFKECFIQGKMALGGLILTAFVLYVPAPIIVSLLYALVEINYEYFAKIAIRYRSIFFIILGIAIWIHNSADNGMLYDNILFLLYV